MKIFASDYDGTIKVNDIVSSENIEALKEWKKAGNLFGIVTGRSSGSMISEIQNYNYEIDFLVCNNGGVIYNKDIELLKTFSIDFSTVEALVNDIRGMEVNCFVLNDGYNRAKEVVCNAYEDYKYGEYSSEYSVESMLANKIVSQIVISVNDDDYAREIARTLNVKYKGKIEAYPNVHCVDIVPNQISKATGIHFIKEHFGYCKEDIHVMGDALNDLSMLEEYQGATLIHGFEELKKLDIPIYEDVAGYLNDLLK